MSATPPSDPVAVDARGMRCPWPVLRAEKALRQCDAVHVSADDPIAASELAALAKMRGWHFLQSSTHEFLLWKQ
jgi:tRNA 2-thiouridine synthesizing protein A